MNPKPPRGRWLHGWRWFALAVAAQPWVLSAQPAPSGARVLSSGGDGASVALGGSMGEQVVLIIDGRTRVVRVGEAVDGMVVRRAPGGALLLETGPGRAPQRLGSTPVRVGSPARGMPMPERLVLQAGGDRLYRGEGEINGRAISGVVDTGASVMVVPAAQARRLGLPEQGGRDIDRIEGLIMPELPSLLSPADRSCPIVCYQSDQPEPSRCHRRQPRFSGPDRF